MWNAPRKRDLVEIPKLYETEYIPLQDKIIHLHFFIAGCDWYIAEWDEKDMLWGYAILNADFEMAEWGYVSLEELQEIKVGFLEVDTDCFWEKRPAGKVRKICKGMMWPIPEKVNVNP
jgi:hypothetical protein